MAALPTVTVEIGFDSGGSRQSIGTAYSSLSWTDVTAYVLAKVGVSFQRGRAEAGQSASAGQLTVSFDNTDGRFTPGTTGGAYGAVRTRMPIRVKAGSTVMWVGFITDIDWKIEAGQPIVSMSASDIIAAAARTKCGPWMTKRVLGTSGLINYWPLTDTAPNSATNNTSTAVPAYLGETARAAYGPNALTVTGSTTGDLSFNVTSDLSPDAAAEPVFALTPVSGVGKHLTGVTTALTSTGDTTVSMWVRPTSTYGVALFTAYVDGSFAFGLHTGASGELRVSCGQSGYDYVGTITGNSVTFGTLTTAAWTHLYLDVDNSKWDTADVYERFRLWVNGVQVTGSSAPTRLAPHPVSKPMVASVGGCATWSTYPPSGVNAFDGQIANVAVFNDSLDATAATARAVFLYNTGGAGAATCATRMGELQYVTPNPAGLSSWITADSTAANTVSPQTCNNKSLLQVAEEVADAERGSIIATRLGKLHLLAQRYYVAPAAASVTLSAETDVMQLGNAFGVDDTNAINECVVTLQPSGWRYTAARTTDPGVESTTLDVWSADQYFAEALALQLANADTERPRAPSLTLSMEWLAKAGLDDEVRGLELGDTIKVTDLPVQAPGSELTLQVRTISHTITAGGWLVNIDTDPPVLGAITDDSTRGLLGDTTYLGA